MMQHTFNCCRYYSRYPYLLRYARYYNQRTLTYNGTILRLQTPISSPLTNGVNKHRLLHTCSVNFDKSKVENSLKEKKKQKTALQSETVVKETSKDTKVGQEQTLDLTKKSLWQRIVAEVKHYYHGFRLLGLDIKIASKSLWKILNGGVLQRRERNQFRRAVADIFRLAPFSVFIIIPFAELALPVVVKLFPNMLPSTFESSSIKEKRLKKELTVKLEMSKFLQDTVEDIAIRSKNSSKKNQAAQDFVNFFQKIRNSDEEPTNEEILKHAKLFEDQLTLDSMTRQQLIALCRLIQVPAVGNNELLRFLLQMKLNRLHSDDKMIQEEKIESLTTAELMAACQARGMRALGYSRAKMEQQLTEWIDLHINHNVPSSLLLLSRVLYMPDHVPVETRVKAAISTLPEDVAGKVEVKAGELNLERVDNTTRYKAAQLENTTIEEETSEKEEETATKVDVEEKIPEVEKVPVTEVVEETMGEGPVLVDKAKVVCEDNKITLEEIDVLEEVITKQVKKDKTLDAAKSDLKDLVEDVVEYQDDVNTLRSEVKDEEDGLISKDTKAGARIQKRIGKLIGRMEQIVVDLEKEDKEVIDEDRSVDVGEMMQAVHALQVIPEEKLCRIFDTLDTDKDGKINIEEAGNIMKVLNEENVEVTHHQLKEIVKLLEKQTETSDKIKQ
ncbi:mitochondrial proton/calcium exchanger protein-like [Ciona intestinalis]